MVTEAHMQRRYAIGTSIVAILLLVSGCVAETGGESPDDGLCSAATTTPALDPADRALAFTSDRSGTYDLWLMGSDGGNEAALTTGPDDEVMPSWSPDGTRLAFVSSVDLETGSADICSINADGTGLRNLTGTADVMEIAPTWSPNGEHIAYAVQDGDSSQIHVMESDGGAPELLVSGGSWPSWSPDGERILFSGRRGTTHEALWTVKVDDDDPNPSLVMKGDGALTEPSWSRDGESIAYVAASGDADASDPVEWNEDIFVMPAEGGPGRRVVSFAGNDHWPVAWSPDSGEFAFTADGEANSGEIFVIDLTTLATIQLTDNSAYDMFPAWRL